MTTLQIRAAESSDLAAIVSIYNHFVSATHITFDLEPFTVEGRNEWFSHYSRAGRHRLLVAHDAGRLVGYASSSRYRPKAAYDTSVETSVYVDRAESRHGIGSGLYRTLFESLEGEDVHRAYAGIALPNDASIALHERFGFRRVALFTEQGRKLGRFWDVAWYEKPIGA